MNNNKTDLTDLRKENVSIGDKHDRIEFVIDQLNDANELKNGLDYGSKVWGNCTVEELIGGLIEAEILLGPEDGVWSEEEVEAHLE